MREFLIILVLIVNFEENLINCVRNLKDFYENNKENKTIPLLNLCSNSEFVSSQKAFLLSKILIENTTKNVRILLVLFYF